VPDIHNGLGQSEFTSLEYASRDDMAAWQRDRYRAFRDRGAVGIRLGGHRKRRQRYNQQPSGAALRVTVRGGPDKDHDVAWVYTRLGWPVEITAEFENWRRVRDSDGAEGWVYHSLLSGKRTASVQLKSKTDLAPLYAQPDSKSIVTAQLQVGVLGTVKRCTGTWCQISGQGFEGWILQTDLWGVYPDEKVE
jgi:SH3-like domain-containing protein